MERLTEATLNVLPAGIARPTYDRGAVTAGIAHIGVGGFHRAHQAMYIDRLLERGEAQDWGICGIGLLPSDAHMRDVLREQDHLYTLVLTHADGRRERRVIGSIVDYLFAPEDLESVLERLASPEIRIVSLTVTEGGYNFSAATGEFDFAHPDIVADLQHPRTPSTVFGIVTEALARRRQRGTAPFTVMSCDNIQGNGAIAQHVFTAFASRRDPDLGAWVEQHVTFPDTMVDRITPVTSDADREENDDAIGLRDAWPVICEPFEQWVILDRFVNGRPDWDAVGAQFVEDVHPYELMKLRLLNASHQAMAYFGVLAGYTYAHEASTDPDIERLLRRYMDEEGTPTLEPVPGIDLAEYKNTLIERFQNPEVRDTLARLCADSSNRIPKWLLPVVREQLAHNRPVRLSAAIVASWARYAEGVDESGQPLDVVDALKDQVMAAAAAEKLESLAFIRDRDLFGTLADELAFTEPYLWALTTLRAEGAKHTLAAITARDAQTS